MQNKLAAILFCAASASCYGNFSIDTVSSWSGTTVAYFGLPNTATYGQTITAPLSNPILTSFSFELDLPTTDTFKGYVFAWNGASVTGSALYTSPVTSTLGTGFQLVTINTGSLALTPGGAYVLAVSASEVPTSSGIGYAGIRLADSYSGGHFVFLNNGTDTSQWTTVPWSTIFAPADDLAFKATFVPIPEPPALAISLTGLAALLLGKRNFDASSAGVRVHPRFRTLTSDL